MRQFYVLSLILLILLPSCHVRRKALEREREVRQANNRKQNTTPQYIAAYQKIAIQEMDKYGIPASITMAQAILESNSGNSELARNANNHFGIKSTRDWAGNTYYKQTNEENSIFRKYANTAESFTDHSKFLTHPRYSELFRLRRTDYKGWAYGLKRAGYATNPKYPELLINLIEKYELWKLD
jgi:flagellum-specific peptidoglycan hydrolase FlgJ